MSNDIKQFYDQFLDARMIGYRIDGSIRISKAVEFAKRHIKQDVVVADIGCGIGILAQAIAQHSRGSSVVGIDISEANVNYALATAIEPNLQFLSASVTDQFDRLKSAVGRPVDIFCLMDVIEHIPEGARAGLFGDLADLASTDGKLLMSYPSPEYQRYLKKYEPEELQVIDNVIDLEELVREAKSAGWELQSFTYVDMWRANQYVHAVFRRTVSLQKMAAGRLSFAARVLRKLDRLFLRPMRVKKYAKPRIAR